MKGRVLWCRRYTTRQDLACEADHAGDVLASIVMRNEPCRIAVQGTRQCAATHPTQVVRKNKESKGHLHRHQLAVVIGALAGQTMKDGPRHAPIANQTAFGIVPAGPESHAPARQGRNQDGCWRRCRGRLRSGLWALSV
jgi:hypothetical protein